MCRYVPLDFKGMALTGSTIAFPRQLIRQAKAPLAKVYLLSFVSYLKGQSAPKHQAKKTIPQQASGQVHAAK